MQCNVLICLSRSNQEGTLRLEIIPLDTPAIKDKKMVRDYNTWSREERREFMLDCNSNTLSKQFFISSSSGAFKQGLDTKRRHSMMFLFPRILTPTCTKHSNQNMHKILSSKGETTRGSFLECLMHSVYVFKRMDRKDGSFQIRIWRHCHCQLSYLFVATRDKVSNIRDLCAWSALMFMENVVQWCNNRQLMIYLENPPLSILDVEMGSWLTCWPVKDIKDMALILQKERFGPS